MRYGKISLIILMIFTLSSCNSITKEYGIIDTNTCANPQVLVANKDTLIKDKGKVYCAVDQNNKHLNQVSAFVKAGYDAKRINEFLELNYYRDQNTSRYINYDDRIKPVSEIVEYVNIGLDQPFYTNTQIISNPDNNLVLVNKYNQLASDYVPSNLVSMPASCQVGVDNGCQANQLIKQEAADAFSQMVNDAHNQGIDLKAISGYRSYDYQYNLYNNNLSIYGQSYTDEFFARPGFSEHQSGLTVDVTIGDTTFDELETDPHYNWLIDNMANYGFILRYPEDKTDITGYSYESWHLRYVGKDAAKEVKNNNITLDQFIARKE